LYLIVFIDLFLKPFNNINMALVNQISSCENCVHGWKNFELLSKEEIELVNQNRYEATFKPGEIIIKQGSPASNALFISSGMAKSYIEGHSGKNLIMSIVLPGRLIVGPGAYVDQRHSYTVAAISTVQACFINFGIFKQLVKENGNFAESLLQDISAKSLGSLNRMVNLSQKKMPGRLADALLYFADKVFNSDEYEMVLSRQELGEMANMAKECVVRILKDFEESKVIVSDSSHIKIIDKEKLKQISIKG
jgi:CRP-like cAMP-binding protein